ncbi:unnamed protein product [Penicillium pancosmium]
MNALVDPVGPPLVSNDNLLQAGAALQHQQSPEILVPREFLSPILEEVIYRCESHSSVEENAMANDLTMQQVREIAKVTTAVARGDFTIKVTADVKREILDLKHTINAMVNWLNKVAFEVSRVATEVGTDGTLGGEAQVENVEGCWRDLTDNVNTIGSLLSDHTSRHPVDLSISGTVYSPH